MTASSCRTRSITPTPIDPPTKVAAGELPCITSGKSSPAAAAKTTPAAKCWIALTLEVVFLGLALVTELTDANWGRFRIVAVTGALMLLLPVGAVLATPSATMPDVIVTGFLAFGLIALLYLVTEELLVEAHETPDRPWVTAMFFAGFLLLLLLEEALA